jgi:hypothetical protein
MLPGRYPSAPAPMPDPTPSSARSPGWSRWDSVKVVLVVLLGVFLVLADPPADSHGRAANAGMTDLPSSEDRARQDAARPCRTQEAADSAPVATQGILTLVTPADRGATTGPDDHRCSERAGATRDGDR